jgi:hypothetical protein
VVVEGRPGPGDAQIRTLQNLDRQSSFLFYHPQIFFQTRRNLEVIQTITIKCFLSFNTLKTGIFMIFTGM